MTHYLVKGDTGSQIKATLTRANGEAINCASPAIVKLYVRKKGTTTILFTLTGAVTTPTNEVIFSFGSNLATLDGLYEGEIEVTNGSLIETVYELVQIQVRAGF